jgi:hypothetical protein
MTTAWLTSDALPFLTLRELAYNMFTEKLDPATAKVGEFDVYCPIITPLVWRGYQILSDANHYRQAFLAAETWTYQTSYKIAYNSMTDQLEYPEGQHIIGYTLATGAIVAAFVIKAPPAAGQAPLHNILTSDIVWPNSIPVPAEVPASGTVPLGTPRFLVGIGQAPGMSLDQPPKAVLLDVLHEQCWRPSTTSFSLATGEHRTIILTQETGVSDTSTDETTLSAALGLAVSGGWGPVSASLSASFSVSQTTSHSRTITARNVSTTEVKVKNDTPHAQTVVYWELVDIYTLVEHIPFPGQVFMNTIHPVIRGTVECVAAPTVARRYTDTTALPATPAT